MSVNPIILKRDADKWNALTASIKNKNFDQNTDEAKAFNVLTNAFNGTFDKLGSEKLIGDIKDNINKYASNRDLQAELKDFASICTLWLTKTETEFLAFKTALNPLETKTVTENEKSGKEETKQINPILLNRDVEKFRKLCFDLNREFESLNVDDQSAFEVLSKYYNRSFDRAECEELINGIKSNLNKYSSNRGLQANLKDFTALCSIWYTKTDYEFAEFKKAMGGKERKPIIVEDKKHEKKEEKKTDQKTVERINFDDGDYYIGELLNGQFHGKGKYYFKDGDWYDGDWLNGAQHGQGIFSIGQRTDTGTYKEGKRFGSGKMVWADGGWYEGGWNENGAHGKGTRYYKDMQRTDTGDFVDGERNGRGVMKWDNGDRYEGTWKDTSYGLNGEGIYYYANGVSERCRYVNGTWQSFNSNNYNTKTYDSGPAYDGNALQNVGAWIWHNLKFLPWVITALLAVIALVNGDGFWSFIGICIGGGIASFILMFLIEILKSVLKWFWNHKWILVVIGVLILVRYVSVSGFVQNLFETTTKSPTIQTTSHQPNYYCTATELNVRYSPSGNARVIGKLKKGDEIYVYEEKNTADFAKIRYNDGVAYVSNKYITKKGEVAAAVAGTSASNTAINIPKTSSVIQLGDNYNAHEGKPKMTENEKRLLEIDKVSCIKNKEYLVKGATILKNSTGSIQSVLSIVDDHATFEYLISYNSKGNFIDCVEIGQILYYAGDRASSTIEGDKIFRKSAWSEPDESGTVYTNYQITPQLTFKEIKTWEERNKTSQTEEAVTPRNEIVGVWEGWYQANQGKSKLILTIKSDMTGIFEFSNMPGMSNVSPGSYIVTVYSSNGTYRIEGKEWIKRPSSYNFLNLEGTISNGQFSGKTVDGLQFQLTLTNTTNN